MRNQMKLSLMVPTFNSAETIERTLASVLAQTYRPLELVVYDEASGDGTREIVERLLAMADPSIDARFMTSGENSGPVAAWRVALHAITGEWCAFVWADDVLDPSYSERMMEGAGRAAAAGRVLVACSGEVEAQGTVTPYYATDAGLASATEFSEGIFLRRFPLTQICAVYATAAARTVFDRHIDFENPRGYSFARHPYGNDVGFLSELAMEGGGVELLGERLVTLVDSGSSMTRQGTREHLWQMRWQYTYNFLRVWRWWRDRGVPDAARLVAMAERRLALCSLVLGGAERWRLLSYPRAVRAYLDFRRLDYQLTKRSLAEHRRRVAGTKPASPSHFLNSSTSA
jgi:glycosyltransferase involved in cell wall biosynthesis